MCVIQNKTPPAVFRHSGEYLWSKLTFDQFCWLLVGESKVLATDEVAPRPGVFRNVHAGPGVVQCDEYFRRLVSVRVEPLDK